jgi:hypothetical protein
MKALSCGHVADVALRRLCVHLLDEGYDFPVAVAVRTSASWPLVCAECAEANDTTQEFKLTEVCDDCARRVSRDLTRIDEIRGVPLIARRPSSVITTLAEAFLPSVIEDYEALGVNAAGWNAVKDGAVFRVDGDGQVEKIGAFDLPPEIAGLSERRPTRLRLDSSTDGRYLAVVRDFGQFGVVIDASTGRVLASLDRGDVHPEAVEFPVAFTVLDSRSLLIHGSANNELDLTDLVSGNVLTRRPGSYPNLSGRLHVSPGGDGVLDDRMAWDPCGEAVTWSVREWLVNPAEPKAGRTTWNIRVHWSSGLPMCWIDDTTVAIAGLGYYAEDQPTGARIFNVETRSGTLLLPGPAGQYFSGGRRLFLCSWASGNSAVRLVAVRASGLRRAAAP